MGLVGRLEGIAPADIFQIISQSKMTGTLIARCPEGTVMVIFKDGQVIEAASDAPRESLGNILVARGMLSETTLAEALDRQKRAPDTPLGMILVEMGAVSALALESVVFKQIEQVVLRLVSCEDGFLTFDRGEIALKRKLNTREFLLPSGVSTEYLLMEGARSLDEERKERPVQPAAAGPLPTLTGSAPSAEGFRAVPENQNPRKDVALLKSMFHEIRLPEATDRVGETGTWVRKVNSIASAMSGSVRSYLTRLLGLVDRDIRAFVPDGRTMMLAGIAIITVSIVLLFTTALTFHTKTTGSVLVVTKPLVNIRENPSAGSMVITQAKKGDKLSYITSVGKWHKVLAPGGVGWISQYMVGQKDKKELAVKYEMTGYEIIFLGGLALFIAGIARRKKGR